MSPEDNLLRPDLFVRLCALTGQFKPHVWYQLYRCWLHVACRRGFVRK